LKHLLLVLTLLSFMLGADAFAETIAEKTSAALQKFKNIYNSDVPHNQRKGLELLRTELVTSLPDGKNSALSVAYTETCIQYTLKYTEKALQEPELLARDLTILEGLKFRFSSKMIYTTSENLYNAQNGSVMGKQKTATSDYSLLKSQVSRNEIENEFSFGDEQLKERIKAEVSKELIEVEKTNALLQEQALKTEKDRYKTLEKWRHDTRILDKYEAQKNKLNDLILKNDRKGVRKMIEAYLPWPVMEPFETQAWKLWLEAIEHPNSENTVTALRGVDYSTDKIQRLTLANGKERIAFMAPLLTKNQGNYTRRLRSLTTKREQNGRFSSTVPGVMLNEQFYSHSKDPKGSSFLSFTIAPEVAINFKGVKLAKNPEGKDVYISNGGLLAVRIDARRLFPNLTSGHLEEVEYLAPLVIFPDEIVAFQDFADSTKDNFKEFYDKLMQKTGLSFPSAYTKMKSEYAPAGLKFMMETSKQPLAGQCSAVFH
jgi:hypothetical protein